MSHPALHAGLHGFVLLAVLLSSGCAGLPARFWPSFGESNQTVKAPSPGEGKTPPGGHVTMVPPQAGEPRGREGEGNVVPAAYAGNPPSTPNGTATRPTVAGGALNLAPGESLAERSLELSRKLTAAEEEKQALVAHAQQLAVLLEVKDRTLLQAEKEVRAAAEDVALTRADLQRWKEEMRLLRERLRGAEQENVATLRSLIATLERVLEPGKPPERPRPPEGPELLKPR